MIRFQSTHPHGVRRKLGHCNFFKPSFNPRTHTGCDKTRIVFTPSLISFNPRTHTGCDAETLLGVADCKVSIHAPTRGATTIDHQFFRILRFQSTHPHGVRRRWSLTCSDRNRVSIHAPTRGATKHSRKYVCDSTVSIHAPTRGATHGICHQADNLAGFNPRTHTGCDIMLLK